jgi:hypothetical protein
MVVAYGPGETNFLKKVFNVQLILLMWFSRWLKRLKTASKLHGFVINMTLFSLDRKDLQRGG